jgi:hypothetical protein
MKVIEMRDERRDIPNDNDGRCHLQTRTTFTQLSSQAQRQRGPHRHCNTHARLAVEDVEGSRRVWGRCSAGCGGTGRSGGPRLELRCWRDGGPRAAGHHLLLLHHALVRRRLTSSGSRHGRGRLGCVRWGIRTEVVDDREHCTSTAAARRSARASRARTVVMAIPQPGTSVRAPRPA